MKNRMCTLALLALAPLAALQAQNPVPKLDLEKLPAEDPKNQLLDLGVKEFKINYGRRPALGDHKVAQWGPTSFDSPDYAIYARKVLPISGPPIHEGVVLVSKGKILAVGRRGEVDVPEGFEEVDAGDGWLMPGLVDLHAHIAGATWDLNDMVHQTNPEFRTLDLVGLHHPTIQRALLGGVTTILYIPGSGTTWAASARSPRPRARRRRKLSSASPAVSRSPRLATPSAAAATWALAARA
jgi:hypothetical protein